MTTIPNGESNVFPAMPGAMIEDAELLRRYAEEGSDAAFAELVRRRIGLVYSVALRQTRGDRHRAEDATQAVFTDLARKSASLARRPVLASWLYRSAHYAAAGLVRAEQRRHAREIAASLMENTPAHDPSPTDWEKVRPVLDEALNEIDERDRDAIVLRFFDARPFAEIGQRLRLSENAARMRVDRALDKLNAALARRGINSATAALGVALGHQIGAAAPASLAASVTGAALAQAAAGAGVAGWLASVIGLSKLQLGIATAVVIAGGAGLVTQAITSHSVTDAVDPRRAEDRLLTAVVSPAPAPVPQQETARAPLTQTAPAVSGALAARSPNDDAARLQRIREADQAVQEEVDRMNQAGNALVKEFKLLQERAKDASLSSSEREQARLASQQKLVEIRAKQREIKTLIQNARHVLNKELPAGHSLPPPTAKLSLRPSGNAASVPGTYSFTRVPPPEARISVRLPTADAQTALAAYELYSGRRIVRDPSLAQTRGTVSLEMETATAAEAMQALERALREQLNIVLEPAADGSLVARLAP